MGLLDKFKKADNEQVVAKTPSKILVVDDEVYLREFYQDLLQRQGFTVSTATNGKEALAEIAKNPPNIIILDIMMPVMDGMEVLRNLWENSLTKKIPVIVLTNAGDIENMDKAKFYSTYQFFVKSNVAPEDIVQAVREALNIVPEGTVVA